MYWGSIRITISILQQFHLIMELNHGNRVPELDLYVLLLFIQALASNTFRG